jgi:concentrative nucleoside transporter, CNT family
MANLGSLLGCILLCALAWFAGGCRRAISPRSLLVLSYALCGFAHVASVGIFVGGVAALAPSRRADLASIGVYALVGATLATLLTGGLAGAFYFGQPGILGL